MNPKTKTPDPHAPLPPVRKGDPGFTYPHHLTEAEVELIRKHREGPRGFAYWMDALREECESVKLTHPVHMTEEQAILGGEGAEKISSVGGLIFFLISTGFSVKLVNRETDR